MRILGHIHTFNDDDVIDRSLAALLNQNRPVDEILLVDNASTDDTLNRVFPDKVTVVRHPENRGTSGAVVTGFQYAMDKAYDWIWVLDADSIPEKDALEELLKLYSRFSQNLQSKTRVLASLPAEVERSHLYDGFAFGLRGPEPVNPGPEVMYYECDGGMWSGSLFSINAVRQIGMPREDYFLDWGDHEYAYRGKRAGYRMFVSRQSLMRHYGHIMPTLRVVRFGNMSFPVYDSPPVRRYYFFRNCLYFYLYDYVGNTRFTARASPVLVYLLKEMLKIAIYNRKPLPQLTACTRGLWDGLLKNMHRRY